MEIEWDEWGIVRGPRVNAWGVIWIQKNSNFTSLESPSRVIQVCDFWTLLSLVEHPNEVGPNVLEHSI